MLRHSSQRAGSCLLLALVSLSCSPAADSAEQARPAPSPRPAAATPPAAFGERLVVGSLANANRTGGLPEKVDLSRVLGSRPVVLFYWIPGNPRADEVFGELQKLADELGPERLGLYGVVYRRSEHDDAAVADRVSALGLHVPILHDPEFELGKRLRVQSVPNITIVDREGKLRLTNGASLSQDLEYKMTVAAAIRRVAETGSLGSYGYLERYYPVRELIGKKCPEFQAPLVSTSVEQHWSSMLRGDRVNVLIFWSVDCPHCRKSLPQLNRWLQEHGEGINAISAAQVTNDTARAKTKEFCELNGFVFPTLIDQDLQITNMYGVVTTPTFVIIRPDGVIDSVVLDGTADLSKTLEEKRKALL